MEDIEAFETGNKVAGSFLSERINERTGDGSIPYKIVSVHRLITIATAGVHLDVGGNAKTLQPTRGVAFSFAPHIVVGCKAILEVDGIDGGDGTFLVVCMTILNVCRKTKCEIANGIVKGEAVFEVVVVDMRQTLFISTLRV